LTPAEHLLLEGMNQIKSGSHDTACRNIKAALEMGLDVATEGRAYSMLAQSQLALEKYDDAKGSLRKSIRRAHDVGDKEALPALHQMMAEISGGQAKENILTSRRERQNEVAETSLDSLLEETSDPNERLDVTLEKADSLTIGGEFEQAIELAKSVLEDAQSDDIQSTRHQVLALIAIANATPENPGPTLERARAIADSANEFNLVTAVVKAANSLKHSFSAKVF